MSCCDDFGNCTQGRNCPVRAAREGMAVPDDEPMLALTWVENATLWVVLLLACTVLLTLLGGLAGYLWGKL